MTQEPEYPFIQNLLALEYGLEAAVSRLAGENENYLAVTPEGARYVFKLAAEGTPPAQLELEQAAVQALQQSGFELQLPLALPTRRGALEASLAPPDGPQRHGRLLAYVPGAPWSQGGPASPERLAQAGRVIAQVALALQPVDHPAAHRSHRWDLKAAGAHRAHLSLIPDPDRRRLARDAFMLWAAARPTLDGLPHSLIHGDLNDEHLLLSGERLSGLLDFGDCLYNPTVCDLAIALAYLPLDEPDPLAAGARIVAAYHQVRPLRAAELELLFPLLCGRLAASVVIAAGRRRLDPDRSAWFVTEQRAWRALARYALIDPLSAAQKLAEGTNLHPFADRGAPRDQLLERRRARFSSALRPSYHEPIKFVRGRAQFLFDESNWPYLDLYNNVCHVGHCHPRIASAAWRQIARLNTNTRYLYDELLDYADRLCATLPEPLQVPFFLNSGSEANELALRLARAHTGRKDILVLENAYHGHTQTLIDISPYKFMGPGGAGRPEPWVHVAPMPDGYRGHHRGQDRVAGVAYGNLVGTLLASLERPPAAFIAETLPSCGGQIIPPPDYFKTAFAHLRQAGALCILDEVQVGLGRVGTHFWAFQMQEVVPDIVVLGKPLGNGHPLAAVVTTREIAESLARGGMEFFSTFGGNPVSCAVGMAVLDVIRDQELQANALRVGALLRDGLRALMDRHPILGDVRGAGLFIGIELVEDRETLQPAAEKAALLVNRLRQRRVLTGTDGPYRNVIKIKGPLVLTPADVELAVATFDELLQSDDLQPT